MKTRDIAYNKFSVKSEFRPDFIALIRRESKFIRIDTVSDDIVNAKIAELRDVYKKSPDALKSLKDPNVKMDIKNRLILEETLNFLVKNNK